MSSCLPFSKKKEFFYEFFSFFFFASLLPIPRLGWGEGVGWVGLGRRRFLKAAPTQPRRGKEKKFFEFF